MSNLRKQAVIFDWQGTLVDVRGIRHLVEGNVKRNFPEFHRQTGNCPPIIPTLNALWDVVQEGNLPIIMTGCSDDFRDVATGWMIKHDAIHNALLMRVAGDFRKDVIIKKEMLDWVRAQGVEVIHAWDDNPNILKLWEDESIPTTCVPGWTGS